MDVDAVVSALERSGDPPPLRPASIYRPEMAAAIESLEAGDAVRAGLHLLNDDLDRAHRAAQAGEGDATADYWHAIVHRREGDFGNSRYWFNRVRAHPVMTEIHGGLAGAVEFVDACRRSTDDDESLRRRQLDELLALLAHSRSG